MANLITIDQLLESVDLNFEPRWVTKDKDGTIGLFSCKPDIDVRGNFWERDGVDSYFMHNIKVSDFESKDWTECIYEVPRKTTGKIERLEPLDGLQHNWLDKINELVDAVNELRGRQAPHKQPTSKGGEE